MNEPHIFYDGTCGLCHSMVRFVLKRMDKTPFYFAPLDGPTFQSLKINQRPDSLVVFLPKTKQIYFKGAAVIFILSRIGKPWKALSVFLRWLPPRFVDAAYNLLAKSRRKFFKQPKTACPKVPKNLQKFFKP
ncbi:thiol-disulfide oxidoreductase DCC family protein [Simkania sp.]|uniref:thiol-disulfide oxidoreductase DCC family protein n=1 Tax=Simkania sp. TaxID=34094 RepID=UPI003B51BB31